MLDINKGWVPEYVLTRSTNLHITLPKALPILVNRGKSWGYIGKSSVDFRHWRMSCWRKSYWRNSGIPNPSMHGNRRNIKTCFRTQKKEH